jgi:hypothetical protein
MPTTDVTWVLERDAFSSGDERLVSALSGHQIIAWQDERWESGLWPRLEGGAVVFHGSLGNAARIVTELPWRPGAFCNVQAFACSAWYPRALPWLLNRDWRVLLASELVANAGRVLDELGNPARVFVRPDSPLKPFSGRVLAADRISLSALDHGFYYDDADIPVVVAPVQEVGREWRYVVVDRRVVAGSAYAATGRAALPDDPKGAAWSFAARVAAELPPPERVYVLDVCEAAGQLRLLELNPFSGADLYACDCEVLVPAVSAVAREMMTG